MENCGAFFVRRKNLALVQHDHIDQTRSTSPNGVTQLFKVWWESIFYLHIPEVSPNMTTMEGGGEPTCLRGDTNRLTQNFISFQKTFQASHPLVGFRGMFFFFPWTKMEGWDFGGVSLLDRTNWTRFRGLYITCRWEKPAWRFHRISVLLKDLRAEKRLTSHRERLDGLWEGCTPGEEILKTSNLELGRVWMIDNYS